MQAKIIQSLYRNSIYFNALKSFFEVLKNMRMKLMFATSVLKDKDTELCELFL